MLRPFNITMEEWHEGELARMNDKKERGEILSYTIEKGEEENEVYKTVG